MTSDDVTISDVRTGPAVPLPPKPVGLIGYRWLEFTADDGENRARVRLELEEGHYALVRFCAERRPGGPELTAEGVRRMPVSAMALRAIGDHGLKPDEELLAAIDSLDGRGLVELRAGGMAEGAISIAVARVYQRANMRNQPAAEAVADFFATSKSTAAKLIAEAKSRGLIEFGARRARY